MMTNANVIKFRDIIKRQGKTVSISGHEKANG
jgi:hypothetical protein